jgi:hypothetical protein
MSHDSSEPKSLIDEMAQFEFDEGYEDDFEDDVYTDDGELQKAYKNSSSANAKTSEQQTENDAPTSDEGSKEEENN